MRKGWKKGGRGSLGTDLIKMNLRYATCLANISSTTGCILVPTKKEAERERDRDRERERERDRERFTCLVYALLSINDFRFPHFLSYLASLLSVKYICFSTLCI